MQNIFQEVQTAIEESLENKTFVKISVGNYRGTEKDLKQIRIQKVLIKKQEKLSFTYRYRTKDIVQNFSASEALLLLQSELNTHGFRHLTLFTLEYDGELRVGKRNKMTWRTLKPTHSALLSLNHNRQKKRKIEAKGQPYLQALGIMDGSGKVYKNAQNKYRQINHYIEILSSLLKELPERETIEVADMGAGKGYLTFALYDYLNHVLQKKARVTGVEFRKDLVDLCNGIAGKSGFDRLQFVEGTIGGYKNPNINVLIALHACDTATDDAIFQGITSNADLIVVAPCCHKQIRREMEKYKSQTKNGLEFLTQYGIFLERQAEMVTDGIRALLLEYHGYSTKVFEFISDAHTPKNVLVVGMKRKISSTNQAAILQKIKDSKALFGIECHHLERLLSL